MFTFPLSVCFVSDVLLIEPPIPGPSVVAVLRSPTSCSACSVVVFLASFLSFCSDPPGARQFFRLRLLCPGFTIVSLASPLSFPFRIPGLPPYCALPLPRAMCGCSPLVHNPTRPFSLMDNESERVFPAPLAVWPTISIRDSSSGLHSFLFFDLPRNAGRVFVTGSL